MNSFFQTARPLVGRLLLPVLALFATLLLYYSCGQASGSHDAPPSAPSGSHQKMLGILADVHRQMTHPDNLYASAARIRFCDSMMAATPDVGQRLNFQFIKAATLLEYGDEMQSVALYEDLFKHTAGIAEARKQVLSGLGVAYLRLGERNNCVSGHASESCIMPIRGNGIHQDKIGSQKATKIYETLLDENPNDLDSRWLLNIAYMTLGEYPEKVPSKWLIPGLDKAGTQRVNPFPDIAADLKLNTNNRAGGSIVDDFDNDGFLDVVTSAWGLDDPMHFMRNNGDGTFTDVTTEAGILSFHPTQTATWNDFNRDGWLDVFIGNETMSPDDLHACELYMNNQNGTFTNVATPERLNITAFVKGVTSGDYDNDGWPDIFISTQNGHQLLLHNLGGNGHNITFDIVTEKAGFSQGVANTFPTGFFDFDNDGWLDLFLCNYEFTQQLSHIAAKEALRPSGDMSGKVYFYRNNRNGTFTDLTKSMGVNQIVFAMGANFGDIDNDGFLDLYFGTGNPNYRSLVPNKMFKNLGGKKFVDVTVSSRTGNLQKGHGVSLGDLDNDGDQDIHVDMGGAFRGDAYPSALYLNPGQGDNNWIYLKLEGTKSNRAAIGAKVTVKFTENGQKRTVYREVNTGASFGCSALRREIGIGRAAVIDEITIVWPASGITQTLKNVQPNQLVKIKEGQEGFEKLELKKLVFKKADGSMPMCAPVE